MRQDYAKAAFWYRLAAKQGYGAAEFDLGLLYVKRHGVPRDYAKAEEWLLLADAQGEILAARTLDRLSASMTRAQIAEAEFNLGVRYDDGRGVRKDTRKAVMWWLAAAKEGYAHAQDLLGFMYASGDGHYVPRNYADAAEWDRRAAAQGDAVGQDQLGDLYERGHGAPLDYATAAYWYGLAADKGGLWAQYSLGNLYAQGQGVLQDYVQAYKWYNLAAAACERRFGSPGGACESMVRSRDRVAANMTPAQIADAQRLSAQWRPSGASAPSSGSARPAAGDLGSGFFITPTGLVLTNAHVVDRCRQITISAGQQTTAGWLLGHDATNDLALLATGVRPHAVAALRPNVRQGDAVAVYGFPLPGLLASSGNATFGNVTALVGPADDTRLMQISAPVQPGNSGGPVLDASGNVVGVVVAKLDALGVAAAIADIPQNVNFAIKEAVVADFLEAQGVGFTQGARGKPLSSETLANEAKEFTVQIVCDR